MRALAALVDYPLMNFSVGFNAAIAQEWPVVTMFLDASPFNIGSYDFFTIDRALRENFAAWRGHETLPPELNAVTSRGRFVAHSIGGGNETAVRNRVAAHHRLPGGELGSTESLLFTWVPADSGRVK